jgi:hypothetical protein
VQPILASGSQSNSVSENFLAFARCGKWLFGCSGLLKKSDIVYTDPPIAPENYNVGQIRRWYKERDIIFENKLSGNDIRALFLVACASPEGIPPLPEKGEAGTSIEIVHDLIEGMVSLSAHVMLSGKIINADCAVLERHVKLFLSAYDNFDKPRRRKRAAQPVTQGKRRHKNQASWISKMNFVSLLNLPDVLRRYGSLRALWEGDRKGEGGLPKIKANVKGGTTGEWARSAATAIVSETALERAIKSAADSVTTATDQSEAVDPSIEQLVNVARSITGESASSRYRDFLCYKNEVIAAATLQSGKPVSLVILQDGTWGMMIQKSLSFVPVTINHRVPATVVCGAAYLGFECGTPVDLVVPPARWESTIQEQHSSVVIKFVLLLPELKKEAGDPFSGRHYFITSDWEEMTVTGNIVRCRVSKAHY